MIAPRVAAALAALLLLLAPSGCRVINADHCLHRAAAHDAWCAHEDPATPFCSPCEADNHGCVAAAPAADECPEYEPDPPGAAADSTTAATTDSTAAGTAAAP